MENLPLFLSDYYYNRTPYVTGTSVLAIKYKDGVLMACDTLACYGSTKRYKSIQRMKLVGKFTVVGFTGELSDFDYISTLLDELEMTDFCQDDECPRTPKEIYNYLVRVMYNRRNKFDPLWNSLVISGWDYVEEKPFLGCVGMIGQHYVDDHVATGFGNHLARPLFRESWKEEMTEQEAEKLLKSALLSCVMRDKQMMNKFQLSKITADGPGEISEPFAIDTRWGYENYVNPTKYAPGAW